MELDAIGELMNISLGSSATAVSNMLDHRVDITTPKVQVVSVEDFSIGELEPAIGIEIKYVSGLEGSNIMLLKRSDVKTIVDILMGSETPDDEFELNELTISAVCEVMNQMMGASATALSDLLGISVDISTPTPYLIEQTNFCQLAELDPEQTIVAVTFNLSVDGVMKSEFMSVMSVDLAKSLSGKMIEKFNGDAADTESHIKDTTADTTAAPAAAASKPARQVPFATTARSMRAAASPVIRSNGRRLRKLPSTGGFSAATPARAAAPTTSVRRCIFIRRSIRCSIPCRSRPNGGSRWRRRNSARRSAARRSCAAASGASKPMRRKTCAERDDRDYLCGMSK